MGTRGIRSRLLISLLVMAGVVLGVALPFANNVIESKFSAFELGKARDDADRLELLLSERTGQLRSHAVDYAYWSDAARYIRGDYPEFIAGNFYPSVMSNFNADHVFVVDAALAPRFAASVDRAAGHEPASGLGAMPDARLASLLANPRVQAALDSKAGIGFVGWFDDRWLMVGVAPIRDPEDGPDSPVLGLVGYAAELSAARVQAIEQLANAPLALTATAPEEIGSRLDGDDVLTRRELRDSDGQASAWLDLRYPRPLLEQTRLARQLLLALSIGIFAVGSLLVWLLLDRGVISRLERMQQELSALGTGERSALTAGTRRDEVDQVAERINRLYGELSLVSGQWQHEAMHDALTGLGNRAQLLQQIQSRLDAAPADAPLALLLIDLDGFKAINDLFGHATGDQVLSEVAACLRARFEPRARCFRLGGDEFALLAQGHAADAALALAQEVNAALGSIELTGVSRGIVGGSIGVALSGAGQATEQASDLLQHADVALYNAKRISRNGCALFDAAMLREMQLRNELRLSLDQAIANGGIQTWFQPIVDASSGQVQRFEALARWQHAQEGWIDPARFVAVAELNNLAAALDLAVLGSALRALPQLRRHAPGVGLSVNVSAQSLLDGSYLRAVTALLQHPDNRDAALTLEITETAFTDNEQTLTAPVAALRALGVEIVLDDFGVGYSSLARLAHIQPRGIKLDGSFVRNREHGGDRICRAVIGLAHEFGIAVTAEWIESPQDAQCLREWCCDSLQGFHFARPLPLADALAWLDRQQAANGRG
jgi:diguanylate cyclase (GGDEF)-like protein